MPHDNIGWRAGQGFEPLERRLLLSDAPFVEVAAASLAGVDRSSASWGDYDGDGRLDILLTGWTGSQTHSEIYRYAQGSFAGASAGLVELYYGWGSWGDYDNDGDLDVLLTGNTHGPDWEPVTRLYRNHAGVFEDAAASLPGVYRSSGDWGDYDNDGDLDILLIGWTGSEHITRVFRNDAGSFTDAEVALPGVSSGSASWGDYDNDGDLDVLITGSTGSSCISRIYRNEAGDFFDADAGLPGVASGSASWGDYDHDGDLDVLLIGLGGAEAISRVYRNDAGSFIDLSAGLPGVEFGSASWGDYDNDGDLDILLAGLAGAERIAEVYRNDEGSFTDIDAGLAGVSRGSAAWGDYDHDGDLDVLLTGWTGSARISEVYRNEVNLANTAPATPANLWATASDSRVTFAWDASSDDETPTGGLTYNLRVGTSPGGQEILCVMADPSTGQRLLPAMGNVQHNLSWTLDGLALDVAYYWSVQAIDSVFGGSFWATEQTLTIASDAPAAPSGMAAAAASASQINLSWLDNADNEDGFNIERKGGDSDTWSQIAMVPANVTSYQDGDLSENTPYYYRMRAYNTAGHSPYSEETTATTFETPPAAASELSAAGAWATAIRLTWLDNSDNEGGFKVERKPAGSGTWVQVATVGANVTSYDDTGLLVNTPYDYRLRAYNTAGNSPYTNEAYGSTLEITVLLDGGEVADNETAPVDFGDVPYGGIPTMRTFTVRNGGARMLTFGSVALPAGYSLLEGLSASLDPAQSDTFTVQLDSGSVGTKSGQISFIVNESAFSPYDFAVTGMVVALPPEVTVLLAGSEIANGQTAPVDFGSAQQGGDGPTRTFTVRNDGEQTLNLGAVNLPTGFSLVEGLSGSLGAGQEDTFAVRLETSSAGTRSGQISFVTNDSDENPFRFNVTGVVTSEPPIADAGLDQWVDDADGDGAATVTLDGSVSTDGDGTIVSYLWSEGGAYLAAGVHPAVSLSVGRHEITLMVTDNTSATDTDEVVITVVAGVPADLVITDIALPTAAVSPGDQVSVEVVTANTGAAAAVPTDGGSFYTTVYLRGDANFDPPAPADERAAEDFTAVAAGGNIRRTLTFAAPDEPGTYYLCAMADSTDSVIESDEQNNWGQPVTLVVVDPYVTAVGEGQARTVTYADADGTVVKVTLRGGTATLRFAGTDLRQEIGRKGVILTGSDLRIAEIELAGTTARSSLKFSARGGDGLVRVGVIKGSTPLGKLTGKCVDLVGEGIRMTGAGVIGSISLHDLTNGADILMPGAAARGAKIGAVRLGAGTEIRLGSYLSRLMAAEWVGGYLEAPWAKTIRIKGDRRQAIAGDFGADVTLDGSGAPNGVKLGAAKVAGRVTGGTWHVTGSGGKIQFASSEPGWTAMFWGDVKSLKVTGNRKLGIAGDLSGVWTSNSLAKVSVAGSLLEAEVSLDQPPDAKRMALGRMTVKGWIGTETADPNSHTWILCSGNVGKVTAGAIGNAVLFAGVMAFSDDQGSGSSADGVLDLPDPASGLHLGAQRARIAGVRVKGIKGEPYCLINSNIAAADFGSVSLVSVKTHSDGVPFGLAADYVQRLSIKDADGSETFKDLDLPGESLMFDSAEIRLV